MMHGPPLHTGLARARAALSALVVLEQSPGAALPHCHCAAVVTQLNCYTCRKNSNSFSKLKAHMMTLNLGTCQLDIAWKTAWTQMGLPWPRQTQLFLTVTKAFRCFRRWAGREQVLAEMKTVSSLHAKLEVRLRAAALLLLPHLLSARLIMAVRPNLQIGSLCNTACWVLHSMHSHMCIRFALSSVGSLHRMLYPSCGIAMVSPRV